MPVEPNETEADINNLQKAFLEQQEKISALKELVDKSEAAQNLSKDATEEKVRIFAEQLMLSKAHSRQKLYDTTRSAGIKTIDTTQIPMSEVVTVMTSSQMSSSGLSAHNSELSTANILDKSKISDNQSILSSTGKEKMLLLHQQLQQNKLRMAQKAYSKLHLEQLMSNLKEKFDASQKNLEETSGLGKSMSDLTALVCASTVKEHYKSTTDLSAPHSFNLETERKTFLENRCRHLEMQLDEAEHDKYEKKIVELEATLSVTQMDNELLKQVIKDKEKTLAVLVAQLELQTTHLDKSASQIKHSSDITESKLLGDKNEYYMQQIVELNENTPVFETAHCELVFKNGTSQELTNEALDNLTKGEIDNNNKQLEKDDDRTKAIEANDAVKIGIARESNRFDELKIMREENEELQESLNKTNIKEITDIREDKTIESLETTIKSLHAELEKKSNALSKKEEELMEKAIELNVLHANFKTLEHKLSSTCKSKPLFSSKLEDKKHSEKSEFRLEMQHLKQKLDDSNKIMIKLKLRCKQLEKQIEKTKNNSNIAAELLRLEANNEKLKQQINELELENEKYKLEKLARSTDTFVTNPRDMISEFENKVTSLSKSLNEKEEELIQLKKGNQTRIKFELTAIRLEEEINNLNDEINTSRNDLHSKTEVIKNQLRQIDDLNKQKEVLHKRLEHYVNENIELLDKLEKLSKSSSSVESIEILERLTQQERAEVEEFSKCLGCTQKRKSVSLRANNVSSAYSNSNLRETNDETSQLTKLSEECCELKSKIELFTNERKEVLQKIEYLKSENYQLFQQIEKRNLEILELQSELTAAENSKLQLEKKLCDLSKENNLPSLQMAESDIKKLQTSQGLNSLQQTSEVVASLDNSDTLFAKCEKCLTKLNLELNAYHNAVDKRVKFNISKKLAKEAKNAYSQLSELLQKVREASNAVETVTVVETVVAVTAPNGKALAEYEQLTEQNQALKAKVSELKSLLNEPRDSSEQNVINDHSTNTQTCVKEQLQLALKDNENYGKKCKELQMKIVDLVQQLQEARISLVEKSNNFILQNHFEQISQVEELNCQELEARCIIYEKEMKILQSLINEQKEQLIITYKECEEQVHLKNFKIQIQEQKIQELKEKNSLLKDCNFESIDIIAHQELKEQCDKLNETLQINKLLVQEQLNELVTKQDTIDALNQQIAGLCNTIQQHANELKQKNKEIHSLQQSYSTSKIDYNLLVNKFEDIEQANVKLKGLNKQQKDALNKQSQELLKLRNANSKLEAKIQELEKQAQEQSEELKKYSASLETKISECREYEIKLNNLIEENKLKNSSHAKLVQTTSDMQIKLLADTEILQKYEKTKHELEQNIRLLNTTISDRENSLLQLQDVINIKDQNVKLESDVQHLQNDLLEAQELLKSKTHDTDELNELLEPIHLSGSKGIQQLYIKIKSDEQQTQNHLTPKAAETHKLDCVILPDRESVSDGAIESLKHNANNVNLSLLTDTSNTLKKTELSVKQLQTELFKLRAEEEEFAKVDNKLMDQVNQRDCQIQEHKEQIRVKVTKSVSTNTDEEYEDMCMQLANQMQKYQQVKDELETKSIKFEKSKSIIKDRNMLIQRLQIQLKDLQNKLQSLPEVQTHLSNSSQSHINLEFNALKESYNKLNERYAVEKSNFQDTITRLETLHDGIQAKLQEDMTYINNLELENKEFKDKICRLEECVTIFEERRSLMERKVRLMDDKMQRKFEYAKIEDELIYRLNTLSEHDDVIVQRLIDSQIEKEELEYCCRRLETNLNELQAKYESIEKEYSNYKSSTTTNYEHELHELLQKINKITCNAEIVKAEYESKLLAKNEGSYELQHELQQINDEKRHIVEQLDRYRDQCSNLQHEIASANESANNLEQIKIDLEREITWLRMQNDNNQQDGYELQELRMQSIQDKTEIENLRHQCDNLKSSYETELQCLRNQITELDSLRMQVGQNQTDDQVFIETENKRLTDLLAEKAVIIEGYQRQILQLQMVGASATPSNATVSAVPIAIDGGFAPISSRLPEEADLRQELSEKSLLIMHLQQDLNSLHREIEILRESNGANLPPIALENFETVNSIQSNTFENSPSSDFSQTPLLFRNSDTLNRFTSSNLSGSPLECNTTSVAEQPTIEDLQRNVSDLEKHAHDLEHKLSAHNRRQSEYDEHIRDLESKYKERDTQYQQTQANLLKLRDDYSQLLQQMNQKTGLEEELRQQVKHLQNALRNQELQKCSTPAEGTHSESESVSNPVLEQSLEMFFSASANDAFEELTTTPDIGDAEYNQSGGLMLASNEQLGQFLLQKDNNSSISTLKIEDGFHKLQISLENSEKQKKELQAKCAKLIKKLKQYKQKNAYLQSSLGGNSYLKASEVETSNTVDDLDITIEEELKSQVRKLEEKLEESKKLEEQQNIERKKLLKRIDILSTANERVAEMQERQHLEVRMYQARIHELEENLNNLQEWESAMLIEDEVTKSLPSLDSNLERKISAGSSKTHSLKANLLQFEKLQEVEKGNAINSEAESPNVQSEQLNNYNAEIRKNNNLILEMQTSQDAHNSLISTNNELIKQIEKKTEQLQDSKLNEMKLQENLELLQKKTEFLQDTLSSYTNEINILKHQNKIHLLNDLQKENYLLTTKTLEEVTTQLHEKEAEVLHLKQHIMQHNDAINENGTKKLIIENLSKNQDIQLFKLQTEDLQEGKEELESKTKLQNSTEKQMEVQQQRSSHLNDQYTIQQLQSQIKNLLREKDYTEAELQVLNQHVFELISQGDKIKDLILEMDLKNSKIKELVRTLETLQLSNGSISSLPEPPAGYVNLNTQWEAIVDDRCREIANLWKIHMAQREEEFKATEFRLREKLNSLQAHNHNAEFTGPAVSTISGLDIVEPLEETETYSSMKRTLDNMKIALESQEVEIITLKEQLAIRSAEYARLAAQFDPFKLKNFSTSEIIRSESDSLVPKTELDLALYMLHQRDMRCEEMTLELLSLLEERDTLQLKLSNTLRQIESIKTQNIHLSVHPNVEKEAASNDSVTNTKHLFNTSNVVDELNQKLSELQTVKYAKDKIIKEEREERSRQMQKIQNDVAKMPSAAISKLIGHNLEQSNQSPSRTLLNWLWGSNVGKNSESME